jgi:hypothetical protein
MANIVHVAAKVRFPAFLAVYAGEIQRQLTGAVPAGLSDRLGRKAAVPNVDWLMLILDIRFGNLTRKPLKINGVVFAGWAL